MAETLSELTCGYCKKTFKRAESLVVHMCEPKRRRMDRSERGVELGFQSYLRFYEIAQAGKKVKTYDEFCESPYYKAFVKFGRYCVATRSVNPRQFTEWLLKNNKKIDNWASDKVYTEYLLDYLKVEAVDDALARSIEYSIDWSEKNSAPAHDCLRYGSTNVLCYAITAGRISPWVIYNSESGQKFLGELNTEQVAMIWPYIDSDVWQKRFADRPEDVEYAKQILKTAGW
jgi:hypothetical protein